MLPSHSNALKLTSRPCYRFINMLPSFLTSRATSYLGVRKLGHILVSLEVFLGGKQGRGHSPPMKITGHILLKNIDIAAENFFCFRILPCATEQLTFGRLKPPDGAVQCFQDRIDSGLSIRILRTCERDETYDRSVRLMLQERTISFLKITVMELEQGGALTDHLLFQRQYIIDTNPRNKYWLEPFFIKGDPKLPRKTRLTWRLSRSFRPR